MKRSKTATPGLSGRRGLSALQPNVHALSGNRSSELIMTSTGRASFAKLNSRSHAQAKDVLTKLPPAVRKSLIGAMRTIPQTLSPAAERGRPPYVLRPPRPGDMGWVVSREGAFYAQEYGWDVSFEALVARITSDFVLHFNPACERCWIAEINGESAGHIFLVKHPERSLTAKLRLLLVEPGARESGLGHVLVSECLQFARSAGYRKVKLWTQSILTAACAIYVKAGFQMVEQTPHHSFGHDLLGQTWELSLEESLPTYTPRRM